MGYSYKSFSWRKMALTNISLIDDMISNLQQTKKYMERELRSDKRELGGLEAMGIFPYELKDIPKNLELMRKWAEHANEWLVVCLDNDISSPKELDAFLKGKR